jgi:hypothetical protein
VATRHDRRRIARCNADESLAQPRLCRCRSHGPSVAWPIASLALDEAKAAFRAAGERPLSVLMKVIRP